MLPSFALARPKDLTEALRLLEGAGARAMSGGTDLLGCLRDEVFEAPLVVSLSRVDSLRAVSGIPAGGLRIGALASVAAVAAHDGIRRDYPALAEAASAVASPQLRHQGTLGGNLCQKPRCWYYRGDFHCLRKGGDLCFAAAGENEGHCLFGGEPCYYVHPSDLAPALCALGAQLQIAGARRTRTLPVEELYVLPRVDVRRETVLHPGEILTDVVLPAPAPGSSSTYRKVRARGAWDFALVGVAIALRRDAGVIRGAKVFCSGVAPVPWRALGVEAALVGGRLDAATIDRAAGAAIEGAEPLSGNAYKVPLLRGLVQERLEALA